MKNVDWGSVISAAAASTLGVLSLIVLAIAFLAFFFFKTSGDRVKLIVFASILLAGVGFGTAVVMQGQSQASPKSPPDDKGGDDKQVKVLPEADNASVPARDVLELSGPWRDDDGFAYQVTHEGAQFAYIQSQNGARVGAGEGVIAGNKLRYDYIVDQTGERGSCNGTLSPDAKVIAGKCSDGGDQWNFKVYR